MCAVMYACMDVLMYVCMELSMYVPLPARPSFLSAPLDCQNHKAGHLLPVARLRSTRVRAKCWARALAPS